MGMKMFRIIGFFVLGVGLLLPFSSRADIITDVCYVQGSKEFVSHDISQNYHLLETENYFPIQTKFSNPLDDKITNLEVQHSREGLLKNTSLLEDFESRRVERYFQIIYMQEILLGNTTEARSVLESWVTFEESRSSKETLKPPRTREEEFHTFKLLRNVYGGSPNPTQEQLEQEFEGYLESGKKHNFLRDRISSPYFKISINYLQLAEISGDKQDADEAIRLAILGQKVKNISNPSTITLSDEKPPENLSAEGINFLNYETTIDLALALSLQGYQTNNSGQVKKALNLIEPYLEHFLDRYERQIPRLKKGGKFEGKEKLWVGVIEPYVSFLRNMGIIQFHIAATNKDVAGLEDSLDYFSEIEYFLENTKFGEIEKISDCYWFSMGLARYYKGRIFLALSKLTSGNERHDLLVKAIVYLGHAASKHWTFERSPVYWALAKASNAEAMFQLAKTREELFGANQKTRIPNPIGEGNLVLSSAAVYFQRARLELEEARLVLKSE